MKFLLISSPQIDPTALKKGCAPTPNTMKHFFRIIFEAHPSSYPTCRSEYLYTSFGNGQKCSKKTDRATLMLTDRQHGSFNSEL